MCGVAPTCGGHLSLHRRESSRHSVRHEMTTRITQLLGSKHTKTGLVDFRRCPRCSATSESLILDAKGRARCHSCRRLSHLSKFALVRLKRSIAVCAGCGSDVPLTPDYAGFV